MKGMIKSAIYREVDGSKTHSSLHLPPAGTSSDIQMCISSPPVVFIEEVH